MKSGDPLSIDWSYDVTSSRLEYRVTAAPRLPEDPLAVWIHRGDLPKSGAALHQIVGGVAPAHGLVTLSFSDRADLAAGRLHVRTYSAQHPGGLDPVPLMPP